jgi:glycosyltransferase involved in cell wall biosynthesis
VAIPATVALLGRRDQPTDAVADYCRLMAGVFEKQGRASALLRVAWDEVGWARALGELWRERQVFKGHWTLVQYTALMWSRHGFPPLFLLVLCLLRMRGARIGVVFHDARPYCGKRPADRMRRFCQLFVMRGAYWLSDRSILNVPLESVSWLPARPTKAAFIPIATTILPTGSRDRSADYGPEVKVIAVLGVTDAGDIRKEVADTALAARRAAQHLPRVRLVTVGRGSEQAASMFRQALRGSAVEFEALGVLPTDQVSQVLANADLTLFVRGPLSTQRSTVAVSIAHGVPLVGYADGCLPAALAEAGVVGVRYRDAEELADATVRVLTDQRLWCELRERNRRAQEKYFSWDVVAGRFLEVLHDA